MNTTHSTTRVATRRRQSDLVRKAGPHHNNAKRAVALVRKAKHKAPYAAWEN